MNNIERRELICKYPSLEDFSKRVLFESRDVIEKYKQDEKIEGISIELLKKIIEDDEYFEFVLDIFNRDYFFRLAVPSNGDLTRNIWFERKYIINGLYSLFERKIIEQNSKNVSRYNAIFETTKGFNFDELKKKYTGEKVFYMNNQRFFVPYDLIFPILEMSNEEYEEFLNNDDYIIPFEGLKKETLIEAVNYFNIELLAEKNLILPTVIINDELREEVFKDMDEDLPISKQIDYIFIKLCKILRYDEHYFLFQDNKELEKSHLEFNQIPYITPQNNEVVCYEIIAIFARFLTELGVNIDIKSILNIYYHAIKLKHSELLFSINNCLISADPLKDVDKTDLSGIKINLSIEGLTFEQGNETDRKKFENDLNEVYQLIQEQEKKEEKKKYRLDLLKEKYSLLTNNLAPLSIKEKLDILTSAINSTNLSGVDSTLNIFSIFRKIFSKELNKAVDSTIIRNMDITSSDKKGKPGIIFVINQNGIYENIEDSTYYLYTSGKPLEEIPKEELQTKCDNGTISIVGKSKSIPGIKVNLKPSEKYL